MKKLIKLLAFFMAITAVMLVQSCDDEDPKPGVPTFTTPDVTTVNVSSSTDITFTYAAPGGFKSSEVTATGGTATVKTDGTAGAKEGSIVVTFTATSSVGAGSITLKVTDNANQSASTTAVLNVVLKAPTVLQGNLTTQTLDAANIYILKNQVFIPNGVTLTIPAGTVIKGERATRATLIVSPGGKLIANGTAASPVVFTSDQPINTRDRGDWGGIIILGTAFVNQSSQPSIEGITPEVKYGTVGTDPAVNATENSGTLTYVRIEYAGIELTPNNETNSLTMGAVGNGTTINYVQASYGGDDGFEWFGGTVSAKNLISFSTWDDDFDTDFGWGGNVQFGVAIRYPFMADQSGSNGFESDSQGNANAIAGKCDGTTNTGCTRGVFSNMTIIGPRDYSTGLIRTGETATTRARAISANFQHAMHIRRRTAISIFNSFISGFPTGLRIDDDPTFTNYNNGVGVLANNVLMVPSTAEVGNAVGANNVVYAATYGASSNTYDAAPVKTYFTDGARTNTVAFPTGSAGWSPVPGTPASSVNPYTAYGINSALFWGNNATTENPQAIDAYPTDPDFTVTTGTLNAGASFADAKLSGGFFTSTTYRGAFGSTDWTNGWTEFRPQLKVY
ncbi:hypothetical protein KK083_17315 [Fulvivirgaceae bacterium PWU4]|uniref:Cell shape-determining protein MreB n=1 Tax=Chryseosolibacter histidini TaxID=2782349 RepID=A0AAP2DLN5_9BACT|nr:hypothetical protein [Chryseosolibacter histidini]MBT1698656.1 hypothetical protein [Chryseosolibacter histidini]